MLPRNLLPRNLSYKSAGVDIDVGNRLIERIKPLVKKTMRSEVMAGLGGFGALFALDIGKYKNPVLVAGTDGVGTKVKLALDLASHQTIGIDLVAMCVNDLIVQGAEPLFFLDYYASGKLDIDEASEVIAGICHGCTMAGAALIGGETAEMPGLYQDNDYDLAGFCVGIVDKSNIIDGSTITPGDQLIALASSGPHSNGYSLIRKIIEINNIDLTIDFNGQSLGAVLLTPTRIYVKTILDLLPKVPVKAMAHITGGGLSENIPRVLPPNTLARIKLNSWQMPDVFSWLQTQGDIAEHEMLRTFNCGVGMVVAVSNDDAPRLLSLLSDLGEKAWVIGEIDKNEGLARVEFV